jgi:CelD/BcsL family acetyltransferase involved in cellulose biosynthesis
MIQDDWTKLARALGADLFASFEWCATWWKHFSCDRRLEIYAFWYGPELVGLFPMFRETLRWGPLSLRTMRVLGSDHAGTRCWPLLETRFAQEVARLLLESISRAGRWDLLQIGDLPGYFPQSDALYSALRAAGVGEVYSNKDYYPHAVFTLPAKFEEYLNTLSGNERNNVRKNERRLFKSHQLKATLVPPCGIPAALKEFFQWHDEYWESQNDIGFFSLWPGSREFHSDVAQLASDAGGPVFLRVEADNQPIGLVCAHRFMERLHLFQAVRAPGGSWESYGPGRILHCETFRWCMAQGISTVDAMSGFYEYKRRLGAEFMGLTSLAVIHSSRVSRMRAKLFKAAVAVVDALYFRLWLCRITPLLRKRFRVKNHPLVWAGMNRRFIRSRFILAALSIVKDKSMMQAQTTSRNDA